MEAVPTKGLLTRLSTERGWKACYLFLFPPFISDSHSVSRKRPFLLHVFRWDLSGPYSYDQFSRYHRFLALPRGCWNEGVLLYGGRNIIGSFVLREFSSINACLRSANTPQSGLAGLGLAESPLSYVRGFSISREPPKLQQASPLLTKWN